jgi:hypothetical protein
MFYSVPDNLIYKVILVKKILCLYVRDRMWNETLLRQPITTSFICFFKIFKLYELRQILRFISAV